MKSDNNFSMVKILRYKPNQIKILTFKYVFLQNLQGQPSKKISCFDMKFNVLI